MPLFRSLSVSALHHSPPVPERNYRITSMDDVSGSPKFCYFYYYPFYRTQYPSYQYNRCRTYATYYDKHYSNWPEHHFNYPYSLSGYKPCSFYGSYTYAPYRPNKSPSGYYYGWYNGIAGF
ncbi:hypothetical protein GPALN_003362 [Globodera pallida]|uniref:Uncharacterized protein n=1 Tax=Globodera rostochiensis TaxID=31243 RepID=A0A914HMQ9_GLORO|nr:hypothetical protein GPALN_003362 [Globodera pallida]